MRRIPRVLAVTIPLAGLSLALGCGDGSVQEMVDKAKATAAEKLEQAKETASEQAGNIKEQVTTATGKAQQAIKDASVSTQEALALSGNMKISAGQDFEANACYVDFVTFSSGRPSVLQFQSYMSADREKFPSVFCRAQVAASSADELIGQTVDAQLFVQPTEDGSTLQSNAPIKLKIESFSDNKVVAQIVGGQLINTADGNGAAVTGTLNGFLE